MRVAVTGTPGTGKTTAVEMVETDLPVVHLNELIKEEGLDRGRDERRGSLYADVEAVRDHVPADALLESHLAHHLEADRVVVLRCRPDELGDRLRDRESPASVEENVEAERLDVVLVAAVERHGRESVYEVDTTDREPAAVAREIEAVIAGDRAPSAGTVSFL